MIKIDEKYYVDSDKYTYFLMEKKFNESKGEYYFSNISYHSNVASCIKKVINLNQKECIRGENEIELKEALKKFQKIKDDCEKMLYPICELEEISEDFKKSEHKK